MAAYNAPISKATNRVLFIARMTSPLNRVLLCILRRTFNVSVNFLISLESDAKVKILKLLLMVSESSPVILESCSLANTS